MVQLWCGYEPFLIRKEKKKVMEQAGNDCMISTVKEFDEEVRQSCFQVSLFGEKTIIFLEVDESSKPSKELMEYVKNPCQESDLYIVGNLDGRTELYRYMKQNNLIRKFNKVEESILLKSIKGKLLRGGFSEDEVERALPLLQERLRSYPTDENYTMDRILIQLDQLIFAGELSEETISCYFSQGVTEKVYSLSNYIFKGEKGKALTLMKDLMEGQESTPIAIGGTLLWQFRNCYKAALLKNTMRDKQVLDEIGMLSFQLSPEYKVKDADYFLALHEKVSEAVRKMKLGAGCEVLYLAVAECCE